MLRKSVAFYEPDMALYSHNNGLEDMKKIIIQSKEVLKQDGSLYTFGRNEFGQLGDGTTSDQMAPRQVLATGVARLSECISLGNSLK